MKSLKRYAKPLMWFSAILMTALVAGCGGDQGRDPILGLPAAALVSVAVTPLTPSVPTGGMQKFVATANYADGASRIVTTGSNWSSATQSVAQVGADTGIATGLATGSTVITAGFGGMSGTATLQVTPVALASIEVVPANPSIAIDGLQQFRANGTFSDGTKGDVTAITTFASLTPAVATIVANGVGGGMATGKSAGTSVIVATSASGLIQGQTTMTVTPATLSRIDITPLDPTILIGETRQLAVQGTFSDGTTGFVTAGSSFGTAAAAKVSVGPLTGVTTGIAAGSSVITATYAGKTATTNVTVAPATLSSIAVTPASASIIVGETKPFVATGTYSDNSTAVITNSVNWTSVSGTVATILTNGVAKGVATGQSNGTATITATVPATATTPLRAGTATLIVDLPPTVTSVAVTPANPSVAIDGTIQFVAKATFSDLSVRTVTPVWNSVSGLVASINASGAARGLSVGQSVIRATFGGQSGTQTLTVDPATLQSILVEPPNGTTPVGGTLQFKATAIFSSGPSLVVTPFADWISGTGAVASVGLHTGVAAGVSAGPSLITATYNGMTDSKTLTVTAVPAAGPPPVNLGTAANFAMLTKAGITNVPTSAIDGNIGTSPISGAFIGITCSEVTGTIFSPDAAGPACRTPDPVLLSTAVNDLEDAYTTAAGRPAGVGTNLNVGAGTVANQTLSAGTYTWGTNVTISTDLTLNGGPNDVWIFQITGTLDLSPGKKVILTGGALPKNIFWVVTDVVTLNTGSHFEGNILAQTKIAMLTGASINGRLLAQTEVTLQQNVVNIPAP